MDNYNDFEFYSLDKLQNIENKEVFQKEYDSIFAFFSKYSFMKEFMQPYYGEPISELEEIYQKFIFDYTSLYINPGTIMKFYPRIEIH